MTDAVLYIVVVGALVTLGIPALCTCNHTLFKTVELRLCKAETTSTLNFSKHHRNCLENLLGLTLHHYRKGFLCFCDTEAAVTYAGTQIRWIIFAHNLRETAVQHRDCE